MRPGPCRARPRRPTAGRGGDDEGPRLLRRLDLIQLDDELLDSAAALDGGILRSLDAIHMAAAQMLADELTAQVTYDARMTAAAGGLGLTVAAPGARPDHRRMMTAAT